jgi:hypothetical protein
MGASLSNGGGRFKRKDETKVLIADLLIEEENIGISARGLGGNALPSPLPAIHLKTA